jgi:hypothetical protein
MGCPADACCIAAGAVGDRPALAMGTDVRGGLIEASGLKVTDRWGFDVLELVARRGVVSLLEEAIFGVFPTSRGQC